MAPMNPIVAPVYFVLDSCMSAIVQLPFRTASALYKLDTSMEKMGGRPLFTPPVDQAKVNSSSNSVPAWANEKK